LRGKLEISHDLMCKFLERDRTENKKKERKDEEEEEESGENRFLR
jgi:hypothetical protein